MAQILQRYDGNLQGGLDKLVAVALERGGRDNITAAAIRADTGVAGKEDETMEISAGGNANVEETVRLDTPLRISTTGSRSQSL
jgi:serine/threonine protein phosphatase PrpC